MDDLFLNELTDLLRETDKLLASADPDTEALTDYSCAREETFARVQAAGFLAADAEGERAALAELINAVLERDRLLMNKLEECLSCCRKELSAVPKARRALNGYLSPRPSPFLQRRA